MCDSHRENTNFKDNTNLNLNKTQGISFYESSLLENKIPTQLKISDISENRLFRRESNKKRGNSQKDLDKFQDSEYRVNKESKSFEMKYRIKLQEQENLILFLKNQAETLDNRYMENLNKMRKEVFETQEAFEKQRIGLNQQYEDKIKRLEDKVNQLERKCDTEITKNKVFEQELDDLRKKKVSNEKDYEEHLKVLKENYENKSKFHETSLENLNAKLEEFKKRTKFEHEQILENIKKEREMEIITIKKEVEDKMKKIKVLEQEVLKERIEVSHKENQLSFLLQSKEEENEKSF